MAELRRQFPVDDAATAAYHNRQWDKAMKHDAGSFSEVFIPNVELVPFYDWSYGCTPTSGAMVCGYVDRVQKSGRMVELVLPAPRQRRGRERLADHRTSSSSAPSR